MDVLRSVETPAPGPVGAGGGMTPGASPGSLERPPIGEIRIDKRKIVVPLVYRAAEGDWNLGIPLIYKKADNQTPGCWVFCWRDRQEIHFDRDLTDGEYLIFRGIERFTGIPGKWYHVIIISPMIIGDDVRISENEAVYIGYYDERQLLRHIDRLPSQIIDYIYIKNSETFVKLYNLVDLRQYSPIEDEYLFRFIARVREYQRRGMNYVLGPPF
jgi:hypothetical protein